MNKFNALKLLFICVLIAQQTSCVLENTDTQQSLVLGVHTTNAAEADLDIDFTPADEDIKCKENHDCLIVEKGCCYHEKPMAIRKDRSFEVITGPKGIRAKCREFNQEQIKKKEKPINCKGRESSANWASGFVAQCKKEDEKKDGEKKDGEKKDGEKKDGEKVEGKCTLSEAEIKAKEKVEIWVKDPIAKISKVLEYKYGETWGELKAKAAKLFGKEGMLIYSPGKTFLDSHVVKEADMKSKRFIMFVPQ